MKRLALALALAGCATVPAGPPLRDPAAPLSSQVDASAARLAGDWVLRASAGTAPPPGARLRMGQGIALAPEGPGRFRMGGGPLDGRVIWVLWLDADNRTAAIGTPDGDFGWIMDRKAQGGADRIRAAREIMEWMGYDMARLEEET